MEEIRELKHYELTPGACYTVWLESQLISGPHNNPPGKLTFNFRTTRIAHFTDETGEDIELDLNTDGGFNRNGKKIKVRGTLPHGSTSRVFPPLGEKEHYTVIERNVRK
jgi:hypothetical protein